MTENTNPNTLTLRHVAPGTVALDTPIGTVESDHAVLALTRLSDLTQAEILNLVGNVGSPESDTDLSVTLPITWKWYRDIKIDLRGLTFA